MAGLAGVIRGGPSHASSPQQAPGAAPGEVCAKLELFLWLGLGKQAKACTSELPLDLLPEPSAGLPRSLFRDGECRAWGWQAQEVQNPALGLLRIWGWMFIRKFRGVWDQGLQWSLS